MLQELLRFLDNYRRRVLAGERLRIVLVEQPSAPGRLRIELAIER